jgi:hypothetical protein
MGLETSKIFNSDWSNLVRVWGTGNASSERYKCVTVKTVKLEDTAKLGGTMDWKPRWSQGARCTCQAGILMLPCSLSIPHRIGGPRDNRGHNDTRAPLRGKIPSTSRGKRGKKKCGEVLSALSRPAPL